MLWLRSFLFLFLSLTTLIATAQEDARKLRLDTRRTLRVDYKSDAWNKDPNKVEASALLIRDAGTGRMAKIEVSETGPNTSLFVGYYQINFDRGEHMTEITPEIYVVAKEILAKPDALKNVGQMIKEGTLLRKPYFLRVESRSIQAISIYDNKEQAFDAYQDFVKTGAGRPIVDRAALEAQKLAQLAEEEKKRREELLKAEAERQRLEDEEKAKLAERLRKEKQLNEEEKARRKAEAKQIADEAMALYKDEKYSEAEEKFQKSVELDPENKTYNFQYAVSLYRNQKYNKSLVVLNLVESGHETEKTFYQGLNYMKLKELDSAYKEFVTVKNSSDKVMGPSAAFFAGVIDYQKENYDSAKGLFEYVIDNSSDPKMDAQAETYLEQIANIKKFQELQKKKFIVSANMGIQYDSNILSVSNANSPTDLAGFRGTYGGSFEYRPVYSEHHEFSGLLAVSDYYSVDQTFQPSTSFQNADPLTIDVKIPYKWKGELFGLPYQLGLTPYYEVIQMNADTIGSREPITNSTVFNIDQTFVMNDNHFANYTIEARRDVSLIDITQDADNQTANKLSIYTTQTWFQDTKKTKAYAFELGYAVNKALGDNYSYNRIDIAGTYMAPIWGDNIWSVRIGYYNANYPTEANGRNDNNESVTFGLHTPLSEILSLNSSLTYMNNSSISTYEYNKYLATTSLAWAQNF